MVSFVMPRRALFSAVAALCILNITLAAKRKAPKVTDILADKDVQEALRTAWKESFVPIQSRGGWIYAESNYPDDHKYILVQHASKDRSPRGADGDMQLDNPEKDAVLSREHYKLVADFHTHPFAAMSGQGANSEDIKRAYERGVPGIVVSCSGVFYYGPERRASMNGPTGYPLSSAEAYNGQKDVRFQVNRNIAPGQCSV